MINLSTQNQKLNKKITNLSIYGSPQSHLTSPQPNHPSTLPQHIYIKSFRIFRTFNLGFSKCPKIPSSFVKS